ncbi:unnamed protein product [Blumeria hordei]|uniref:Uncharacterized protein n=1 Tax=Blumeria hordei TaxID=2867405 RepID=A0A383UKT2_BLUHO|nr:unnamed protein product [Blumeria hordei]
MYYFKPNFVASILALSIPSIVVTMRSNDRGFSCDGKFFPESKVLEVEEKIAQLRAQPQPLENDMVLPQYPLQIMGVPKPRSKPKYAFPILESGEIYNGGDTGPYFVFVNKDNSPFHVLIKEGVTWRKCIWGIHSVEEKPKARPIDSSQSSSGSRGFSRSGSDSMPGQSLADDADSEVAKIYGWTVRGA